MRRGPPTSRDLWVALTFEQDPAGAFVARLAVEEPDGWLVELELTGDELACLLAGETLTVSGEVSGVEQQRDEELAVELDAIEPQAAPEDVEHVPADVKEPTPAAPAVFGASFDEPPAGTEPIARSTDVAQGEAVVAYIHGRWLGAVVARRDVGTLLVTYSRPGSFGQVQQRIATDRVRRRR
jgi:hypothetical protein